MCSMTGDACLYAHDQLEKVGVSIKTAAMALNMSMLVVKSPQLEINAVIGEGKVVDLQRRLHNAV